MSVGVYDSGDHARLRRKAVMASVIGSVAEWYDFLLYGQAAALVFPKLFFSNHDPFIATQLSFATFWFGIVARTVGALIFGPFGDRVGRKAMLVITLIVMGVSTTAIGLLPTYAQIGVWAAVLLTLLRLLQGLGVGGEWGGSVLLAMEWSDRKNRGFFAALPQLGGPIGLILGSGALALFSYLTGPDFLVWGWRIPFLFSAFLLIIGLYIRLGAYETPVFTKILEQKWREKHPMLAAIRRQPREIIFGGLARVGQVTAFYLFTVYVISYGTTRLHLPRELFLLGVVLASVGSVITTPFWGWLSDHLGRRWVYRFGIAGTALASAWYFNALDTKMSVVILLTMVISLIPHDAQYSLLGVIYGEAFTGRLRYSGASLAFQWPTIIGGLVTNVAGALLMTFGTTLAIEIYMFAVLMVSWIALGFLPDRQRQDHDTEYDLTRREAPAAAPTRQS